MNATNPTVSLCSFARAYYLRRLTGLGALLAGLLFAGVAQAANFSPTTEAALSAAITTANGNAESDVINLGGGTIVLAAALPDIDADGGNALTIQNGTIQRLSSNPTAFRILNVLFGANLALDQVTVTGGSPDTGGGGGIRNRGTLALTNSTVFSNTATASSGGGIESATFAATLTLTNSTVSDNTAAGSGGGISSFGGAPITLINSTVSGNTAAGVGSGGGIENSGGSATLTNSTVSGNTSGFSGGGIFSSGGASVLTLTNSTVSGNTSASTGGGIHTFGAQLTNSSISGNAAGAGGGITILGNVTLTNSTVSGNTAADGGGIRILGGSILNLTNSTLSGNTASDGGGIDLVTGTANLTNSTVSGNTAVTGVGGGIKLLSGTANLTNSTISANTAANGGGIFNFGTVNLINSIVANQASGGDCGQDPLISGGNNLESGTTCGLAAAGDLQNTDPMLGPLAFNGGTTQTHALLPGSPAINAGNNAACVTPTDQRGQPRIVGGTCDIGAFEASAVTFAYDFGDAPDANPQVPPSMSYPTLITNLGAGHVIDLTGPFLGIIAPDAETDGQPDANADGDGGEDDGFTPTTFEAGATTPVTVTVSNPVGGFGSAWIDLNQDGDWDDAGEILASDADTSLGTYTFNVTLPAATPAGTYFVRARVCSAAMQCSTPRGIANDGEVEDYAVTVPGGGGAAEDDDDDNRSFLNPFGIGSTDPLMLTLMGLFGVWRMVTLRKTRKHRR